MKDNNNDINKKFNVIMFATVTVFAVLAIVFIASDKNDTSSDKNDYTGKGEIKEISAVDYFTLLEGTDKSIIYIARPTCSYCQKYEPIVTEFAKESKYDFNYLNTDELSESEMEEIYYSLSYFETNGFSTPAVLVVQNGKLVDSLVGYNTKEALSSFIYDTMGAKTSDDNNDSASGENIIDSSSFNAIDVTKYKELYNADEKSIVYVASTTCSNCIVFSPILKEVTDEYNLDINYINLEPLSDTDLYELYQNNTKMVEDGTIYTPAIYIVQGGNVVANLTGSSSKDATINFFKEQGYIK